MSSNAASPEENNPFRRPGFLIAAAFLALVAVLGVIVVLGGSPDSRAGAPPSPAPPSQGQDPAASGSACGLTDRDQSIPTSAPADVTWSVFKTVAVPTSRSAGPGAVEGDVARCYAHTPRGALIAAWQIATRRVFADNWREVVRRQVMPGPGRDAYAKQRATVTDTSGPPGQYGQLAGFRFVTYTPQVAVIQTVSQFFSGRLQMVTLTMMWSEGDWKMQLQPDGASSPGVQPVASLAGFISWGGV